MPTGDWTFITGATGFIGHVVLAALLRQGARCIALVRGGDRERLYRLLRACDPAACDSRRLRVVAGELPDDLPGLQGWDVARVVHAAGNTNFHRTGEEPARTNVLGTRRLLDWMDAHAIADLTHVSTTYVCGAGGERAVERVHAAPPRFNNAYERSKWEAEQLVWNWGAARRGRRVVLARPSIVTGAFETGRATEFRGFYLLARAVEQLSRRYAAEPRARRHAIRLRLRGNANSPNQLVPVDYVSRAIAALAADADASGVYHLAHPAPPTNGQIKGWLEELFDISGGEFIGEADIQSKEQSADERAFHWGLRALEVYFANREIDCARAVERLARHGITCPAVDLSYVRRCVEYAQARRWGRAPSGAEGDTSQFGAAYFERFLPAHLGQSLVARITPIRATVRFAIDRQEWLCRFAGGRLESVQRGPNGVQEDFGYRTTCGGFWRAISGQTEGDELFASGEADVFGDVEAALKMAAILREFTREFPCTRQRLEPYLERA